MKDDNPITHKVCRECKEIKPRKQFYASGYKDRLSPYCIPCHISRQSKYKFKGLTAGQQLVVGSGLCLKCKQPRGEHGTKVLCRTHADETVKRNLLWRKKLIDAGLCISCRAVRPVGRPQMRCITCSTNLSKTIDKGLHQARKYGITKEFYLNLSQQQNHACAICRLPDNANKRLGVDHCHKTGKVRGLLCSACNSALGLFKDSVDSLKAAIEYLNSS